MNILIVEYPGYSIYAYEKPDPNIIFSDSLIVYDWIKKTLKVLMIKFLYLVDL
jgi:hypothetical protein